MFCGECGSRNPDTNAFCNNCGKPLKKPMIAGTAQPVPAPAAVFPATPPEVLVVPASTKKTERLIIYTSVTCGIASFFIIPYMFAIVAIALGIFAVYKKDRLGVTGVVIGMVAILVDYGYVYLFSYGMT
jgi:hypothetical protein